MNETPLVVVDVEGGLVNYDTHGSPAPFVVVVDWDVLNNEDGIYENGPEYRESILAEMRELLPLVNDQAREQIESRITQIEGMTG